MVKARKGNQVVEVPQESYEVYYEPYGWVLEKEHKENKEKLEQPREEIVTQKVQNEDRGNKNRRK